MTEEGGGQDARATGGPGILPGASTQAIKSAKQTVLGILPARAAPVSPKRSVLGGRPCPSGSGHVGFQEGLGLFRDNPLVEIVVDHAHRGGATGGEALGELDGEIPAG